LIFNREKNRGRTHGDVLSLLQSHSLTPPGATLTFMADGKIEPTTKLRAIFKAFAKAIKNGNQTGWN